MTGAGRGASDGDGLHDEHRSDPRISVVVGSRGRALRLRWLLNRLEQQTLASERWELVVAHDDGEEIDDVLQGHPLAAKVTVRVVRLPAGSGSPARNRNAGWRAAGAPVIAFTDERCLPPPEWVERALEAAERHPGAIVQGTTKPDPVEWRVWGRHAPHVRTRSVDPPDPRAQACNILYPRAVLDAAGGFPEDLPVGAEAALAADARARGFSLVAAPVLTHHAVEEVPLWRLIHSAWRFRDLPLLVARHPGLRQELTLRIFCSREHAALVLSTVGVLWLRTPTARLVLLLPYVVAAAAGNRRLGSRTRLRALLDLPDGVARHGAEIGALMWGSLKHRALLL